MTISIREVSRHYDHFAALDRVSLDVEPGELLALLGPSGSGKSTLLRILAGLDDPDRGSVLRHGEDLLALDASRRGVGLVFQHYALFAHMTVAENVAFGLRVRPWRQRPRRAVIAERVRALLERVQLADLAGRYPVQLSGGQRQRVALARALAVEPTLLLLDEPFGALDAQVRVSLRGWLRELQRSLGLTTILVTHDQDEALELADRVVVMNQGRVEQVGRPMDIYRSPATPFVHGFVGRATRFDATIAEGGLLLGEHLLRGDLPDTGGVSAVEAWVRPEHVLLTGDEPSAWKGRVLRLAHAGSVVHATVAMAGEANCRLEAEWHVEDVLRRGIAEGDEVHIFLRELRLYAGAAYPVPTWVFRPWRAGGADAQGAVDLGRWLQRRF